METDTTVTVAVPVGKLFLLRNGPLAFRQGTAVDAYVDEAGEFSVEWRDKKYTVADFAENVVSDEASQNSLKNLTRNATSLVNNVKSQRDRSKSKGLKEEDVSTSSSDYKKLKDVNNQVAEVLKTCELCKKGSCFVAGTMVWTSRGLRRIEKLQVGDVALTYPDGPPHGIATTPAASIEPRQCRVLCLLLKKSPTHHIYITLLRSPDWIEYYGAHVGGSVLLDMPEMGVCFELSPGKSPADLVPPSSFGPDYFAPAQSRP